MPGLLAPARRVRGEVRVPGDKSIGHRAIIFGSLAEGETTVTGFSRGEDNRRTQQIFRDLGVDIRDSVSGDLVIRGVGLRGLSASPRNLECGNSGTTMRLVSGVLAGQPFESRLDGDASLRRRPMRRIAEPLRQMGAKIQTSEEGTAPLTISGGRLHGLSYSLPVASAQVKSCILLAGLYASGETRIREPGPSRDHTERMFTTFGAPIGRQDGWLVAPRGRPLSGVQVRVPGDLSSAAFLLGAALMVPDSEVTVVDVGLNPTRSGILELWRRMGANLTVKETGWFGGEPVGAITARHSDLRGIEISGEIVVRAIDEIPLLVLTAAVAEGQTLIRDATELRTKESDRLAAMATLLTTAGAKVQERPDGLLIEGSSTLGGGAFESRGDHRVGMCAALVSLVAPDACTIDELDSVATSFPGFFPLLDSLCER